MKCVKKCIRDASELIKIQTRALIGCLGHIQGLLNQNSCLEENRGEHWEKAASVQDINRERIMEKFLLVWNEDRKKH